MKKYKLESNSWEDISSFDLGIPPRERICVVASDNFIYLLGGMGYKLPPPCCVALTDADRYDLRTNTWHKIAAPQRPRKYAHGAAASGKVFIAGGAGEYYNSPTTCEMYDETTKEWQFIGSMPRLSRLCGMAFADGKLYVVNEPSSLTESIRVIECYDPNKNEWNEITRYRPQRYISGSDGVICSARAFKGCNFLQQCSILDVGSILSGNPRQRTLSGKQKLIYLILLSVILLFVVLFCSLCTTMCNV